MTHEKPATPPDLSKPIWSPIEVAHALTVGVPTARLMMVRGDFGKPMRIGKGAGGGLRVWPHHVYTALRVLSGEPDAGTKQSA